jgi:hypothetical protein
VVYRQGALTERDYNEAIEALTEARDQLTGAGPCGFMCCAVCEDTGHTAEDCHHNPLILARRWAGATSVWTCYHCGFVATNDQEAVDHFGTSDAEVARCLRERAG